MHYISVEKYGYGEGPLQAWDARLKVAALLLILVGIGFQPLSGEVSNWLRLLLLALLLAALFVYSGLPLGRILARSLLILPFASFLALAQLISLGRWQEAFLPLVGGWGLALQEGGGERALMLCARVWLSVVATLLVIATTPFARLLAVMEWARVPQGFVQVVGLLYRTLWVLGDEVEQLLRARRLRSFRRRPWLAHRAAGGMVASLFVRTLERSRQLHRAMLLRGYRGSMPLLDALCWTRADSRRLLLATVALLLALIGPGIGRVS